MPINPAYVDVDHQFTGYLSDPLGDAAFGDEWPSTLKIWDRSDWQQRITELKEAGIVATTYTKPYNNQSPESSCVLNATECAWRTVRNRALGMEHEIKCSPMSIYGRVANSRHSGYYMWKALGHSRDSGFLPESSSRYMVDGLAELHAKVKATCKHHFHQNTPFQRRMPDGWEQTARHFRVLEWLRIDSVEQFGSAMLHGYPVVYGRSGHSICAVEMVYENGKYLAKYCDSYGPGRGQGGFLFDSTRMWSTGGAWACRAVVLPDDPAKPAGEDGLI